MNPIGCNSDQLKDILIFSGYDSINLIDGKKLYLFKQKKKSVIKNNNKNNKKTKKIKNNKPNVKVDPNSPFAVLKKLL